jgi:hypothetical protein
MQHPQVFALIPNSVLVDLRTARFERFVLYYFLFRRRAVCYSQDSPSISLCFDVKLREALQL